MRVIIYRFLPHKQLIPHTGLNYSCCVLGIDLHIVVAEVASPGHAYSRPVTNAHFNHHLRVGHHIA